MRGCRPLKEIASGKIDSPALLYFALTTCLPTDSLPNLVSKLRSTETPMYSPLRKRPNLAVFFGPSIVMVMPVRASAALSLGGAGLISENSVLLTSRV